MDKYHHEMQIDKHLHLARFLKDKYNDLLIADTLRLFALSMISLFVPIFLLKTGFSIMNIAFFELGMFVFTVPFQYLILLRINKWKVERALIVSYFVNILFYISLFYTNTIIDLVGSIPFLFLIGFVNVLAVGLYWTAHHIYFVSSIERKDAGSKTAILSGVPVLVAIASPFIGSILITNFSFKISFLVSAIFLLIASIVLFFSGKIKTIKVDLDMEKIIDKKNMNKNLLFTIQGLGSASTGLVWPLLLFFLSVKLLSMGVLYLFSNLAYAVIGYWGGKRADKNGSHKIVKIGAAGHGISMIFRAFATSIIALTTFQTMGGIFGGLIHISLDAGFFRWSREDIANSIMNRELYMHIGRFFSLALLLVLLLKFTIIQSLISVLVISGLLTFILSLFVSRDGKIVD
ncbi:MAG: hypothetical protein PF572_00075 [Patescibacteria group bacterium]|jgi:MFS family permease|nr:hypothetical protein [Patescibacteria group bacterium]